MTEQERMARPLAEVDPEIAEAIRHETERQNSHLELIASENFTSEAILEATGSVFTNKYAEGYPGKRYYGGCEFTDIVENLARERAKKLFHAEYANVQPHSGSQANEAAYASVLQPGDTILGLNLAHGGHLTHGHPLNFSGKTYKIVPYGVSRDDERIDYDELARLAEEHKPKMIIAGGSAYPRTLDFPRFRQIADSVGALFLVDMAHFSGLVAAGLHPNPCEWADIVTSTTHKTLRGPRSGLILAKEKYGAAIDKVAVPRRAGRTAGARDGGQGGLLSRSRDSRIRGVFAPGAGQRANAGGRLAGSRIPDRLRRHRYSRAAGGCVRQRHSRQGSAIRARVREHHRQPQRDSVRSESSLQPQRDALRQSRGHHARIPRA